MLRYIALRILSALPVMFVVAVVVFGILYLAPGDPAAALAGDNASPADIARVRASLGLDRPFYIQFVIWLWNVVQGNLGSSLFDGKPVLGMIVARVEPTLSLMVLTILMTVVVAIPLGVAAASRINSVTDRIAMSLSVLAFSVPVYVVGYALILGLSMGLHWFPVQGYVTFGEDVGGWLRSITLPSLAMAASYVALVARMTRTTLADILTNDYIRTARSKGIAPWRITYIHALRNAAVPITTVIGSGIAMLIGGAVVTESVFGIPGIGKLTIDSISKRDIPVIQGVVLTASFVYVFINLLLDILYKWLDPRIQY